MAPTAAKKKKFSSIEKSLAILGIGKEAFIGCLDLTAEFKVIKRVYFKAVLISHPDKGGDIDVFREQQISFELLRGFFETGKIESFSTSLGTTAETREFTEDTFYPTYDFYESAAASEAPTYCVELARSDRSTCKASKNKKNPTCDGHIPKGDVRIGSYNQDTGTYQYWAHLRCWRVPLKVWSGLPDPDVVTDPIVFATAVEQLNEVSLCGFLGLPEDKKAVFVAFLMCKVNWAQLPKLTKKGITDEDVRSGKYISPAAMPKLTSSSSSPSTNLPASSSLVPSNYVNATALAIKKEKFVLKPGENGALPNSLSGQIVVMTGIFPELGGGAGLTLGKDRAKTLLASFGAKVTASVSGKTHILLVGQQPGSSKVVDAQERGVRMIGLHDLKVALESGIQHIKDAITEAPVISAFSTGYGGNSRVDLVVDYPQFTAAALPTLAKLEKITKIRRVSKGAKKGKWDEYDDDVERPKPAPKAKKNKETAATAPKAKKNKETAATAPKAKKKAVPKAATTAVSRKRSAPPDAAEESAPMKARKSTRTRTPSTRNA